jgi:hypothetical protein
MGLLVVDPFAGAPLLPEMALRSAAAFLSMMVANSLLNLPNEVGKRLWP